MDEKMTVGQAQKKLIGILLRHVPFGHSGAQDGALALDALTAALAGKDVESLACGHHKSLAIISAETGKFLYCDLCDARSAQRDAEEMEAKYAAQVEALEAEVARLKEVETKYHELILQVGNKYSNESRHETAMRYIRAAENVVNEPAKEAKA